MTYQTTNVYLREDQKEQEVRITNKKKPFVLREIKNNWETIVTLLAKIGNVPAGLIMEITDDTMKVFVKSQNSDNPYPDGGCDKLGSGLYCETVIGKDNPLLVPNSLEDERWNSNPDVKIDMISYYGVPLKWPDNEFFGTICVLDNKTNHYTEDYKQLLREFKKSIEKDLSVLCQQQELKFFAEMDGLTKIYNRRMIDTIAENEFNRSKRNSNIFTIVIFDLNKFKEINDTYGHDAGDRILKAFSIGISQRIRNTDSFGRWGGDEFILVCPDTTVDDIKPLLKDVRTIVKTEMDKISPNTGFSFGLSQFNDTDNKYADIIKRADIDMYKNKKKIETEL